MSINLLGRTSLTQPANLSSQATIAQFDRYVIPNYRRFPSAWVRRGVVGLGRRGQPVPRLFPGWGCNLLGHCPPRVVEAVREQVGRLDPRAQYPVHGTAGALAEALAKRSFHGQSFFCNSGAEANEAAINWRGPSATTKGGSRS